MQAGIFKFALKLLQFKPSRFQTFIEKAKLFFKTSCLNARLLLLDRQSTDALICHGLVASQNIPPAVQLGQLPVPST